jgi:hypothetical protein
MSTSTHAPGAIIALILSSLALTTLAAPQNVVTLYGISPDPPSTSTPTPRVVRHDAPEIINDLVVLNGEILDASAVAVDGAGATIYVGVLRQSLIPTYISPGIVSTATQPTPTSMTSQSFFFALLLLLLLLYRSKTN